MVVKGQMTPLDWVAAGTHVLLGLARVRIAHVGLGNLEGKPGANVLLAWCRPFCRKWPLPRVFLSFVILFCRSRNLRRLKLVVGVVNREGFRGS